MAKTNKIRIKLKAYDHKILDASSLRIIEAAKATGAKVVGPIPLPTEKQVYTILRAVHKYKDSREQFEMRTHKRLIDIVTNLTVNYVVMATIFFTSREYDIFANRISWGVTESANSCIYIGVTARTGVSGKTTFGTCGCGNNAGVGMLSRRYYISARELVAVIVYSYYLEGVFYLRLTVSGNLEITDAVVLCKRVGNVFIIAIYGVLNSAFYLVPGELHLSAFLVGSGYCDGQLTFAGQSVDALSTCDKSHSAGESNYESKYGYERAKLSE